MRTERAVVRTNLKLLVESYPHLVKNRNNLCAFYWSRYEGARHLGDLKDCTPAETIVREFRNLVSTGSVILDVDVKEALQEKETEYYEEALK